MPDETAQQGAVNLKDAIDGVAITGFSHDLLQGYLRTLSAEERSPPVNEFFTFAIRYIEYNRTKYLTCKHEILQMKTEIVSLKTDLASLRREVQNTTNQSFMASRGPPPRVTSTPNVAAPTASGAAAPMPAPVFNVTNMDSVMAYADGTYSRLMGSVGNNVRVFFSADEDRASRKSKLVGPSTKMDVFTGQDMSQFPEWVAQFLAGINLYQPTEPHACRMAISLLRGKAAEMANKLPETVSMNDLQELLTSLDGLFNATGNRMVAVNLFNSYSQREDVPIQDYSLKMEHLFYRAYPGKDPNESIFLMDRFISGLVSPQIKEKLRIPPQPVTFREAVNSAMAYTAAIFPEHQILRQRSLAWKMAASSSHPLMTRSLHGGPQGSIHVLESSIGDESIQAIRRWCALHKTDKHSDSDCRAQQESAPPIAAKRRSAGGKTVSKPRRLRFKTKTDRKKFLRSIDEMEGVSFEDNSDNNDDNVAAKSLMQLNTASSPESTDEEDNELDLQILVIQTGDPLPNEDVIMEDINSADKESQDSSIQRSNQDPSRTFYKIASLI